MIKSTSPRVSVIMPAYNSEKYVGEAIKSILNQTFKDFEFIIINDGSTDNTAKIIQEYATTDKRIRFVNGQKNCGFIATLNKCLDMAVGEYIAKMDSDDISLPDRLEKQVNYLDTNASVGLVGTGYKAFGNREFSVIHPDTVKILDMIKGCYVTIFMLRKQIIDNFNLRFDDNFYCAEDYDFYSRFIRYAEIRNIPEVLYLYRLHDENVSTTKSEIQRKNSYIVRQNLLNLLTSDEKTQSVILDIVYNKKPKTGILLPKWFGRFCCLFILKRKSRHNFRNKYVRD